MKIKTIIDVRTPREYATAHAKDSINIPLEEIGQRAEDIRRMARPLILCCSTGDQSARAEILLDLYGIESINAGSWQDVNLFFAINDTVAGRRQHHKANKVLGPARHAESV